MTRRLSLHRNQQGLVSITVTLVFILVISIITTSFAFLMRREQRQALDRQLSTQAFYVAESGINDALAMGKLTTKTDCENNPAGVPDNLEGATFEYTCLLVDESPSSLSYQNVSIDESTVVRLTPESGKITRLKISWHAASGYPGSLPANAFAPSSSNFDLPTASLAKNPENFAHHTGILRATLIPTNNLSRPDLINKSQTLFLYPRAANSPNNGGQIQYRDSTQDREGRFVEGNCHKDNIQQGHSPRYCSVTIHTISPGGTSSDPLYLRLVSLYQNSSVEIEAFDGDTRLNLVNTQYVIDVTGRANDVLRRVQVRVPRNGQYYYPEFALESGESICKRLLVYNSTVSTDSSATDIPACNLNRNDN